MSPRIRLVLVSTLLSLMLPSFSGQARAQSVEAAERTERTRHEASLRSESEPGAETGPPAEPVSTGRVIAEVGGMAAGVVGSAVLGVGVAAVTPRGGGDLISDSEAYGLLAFLGGIVFLVPVGATVGGNMAGGQGSYGYTLLGNLSGLTAGTLIAIPLLSGDSNDTRGGLALGAFVGSVVAGNVLGYELSSAGESADDRETGARLELRPMALVTPEGAVFGASGAF